MQQLVYPSFITSDEYKLRSITFTAMSSDIDKENSDDKIREEDQENEGFLNMLADASEDLVNNVQDNIIRFGKFTIEGQIVLPLPDNIVDSQSHAWGEQTGLIASKASPFLNNKLMGNSLSDFVIKKTGMKKDNSFFKFMGDTTIGESITYGSYYLGLRKPVLDPSFFQTYNGSSLRSFTLIFNFIPESVEESQTIQKIILTLKNWTSPTRTFGSLVMLSPYYFQIEFGNPYITQMFNMNCAVCKEIQVDYGADGNMQQFQDGFPKQITLTMAFNEAKLSYSNNYKSEFSQKNHTSTLFDSSSNTEKTTETPTIKPVNTAGINGDLGATMTV